MTRTLVLSIAIAVGSLALFGGCASAPSREAQEMAWFINYLNTAPAEPNK